MDGVIAAYLESMFLSATSSRIQNICLGFISQGHYVT